MNLNELTLKRRSVRGYEEGREISKEAIEELINTTLLAPTWKNSETGRYYVVMDEEKKAAILETLPDFNQKSAGNASALIVTTFVKNISGFTEGVAENECGNEWGAYDLGCQNTYMILKASDMGMDTLIMGIRDSDKIRNILPITEEEEVMAVIALGYGVREAKMPRRKAVEEVCKIY